MQPLFTGILNLIILYIFSTPFILQTTILFFNKKGSSQKSGAKVEKIRKFSCYNFVISTFYPPHLLIYIKRSVRFGLLFGGNHSKKGHKLHAYQNKIATLAPS
jgi:hypothetical protein